MQSFSTSTIQCHAPRSTRENIKMAKVFCSYFLYLSGILKNMHLAIVISGQTIQEPWEKGFFFTYCTMYYTLPVYLNLVIIKHGRVKNKYEVKLEKKLKDVHGKTLLRSKKAKQNIERTWSGSNSRCQKIISHTGVYTCIHSHSATGNIVDVIDQKHYNVEEIMVCVKILKIIFWKTAFMKQNEY